MRACVNTKCVAFERVVYSVATRCPLCKWDLKSLAPASEAPRDNKIRETSPSR